ncbi:MAG: DUF533 domain-containing protein [Gemmobacter sp.]|uniref:DUF533 domain-containing protein n=1 Tax=Gemmobacter sp. TaxID=1898957 RepID=UPI001A393316|nr:DUF533 domain-containing protein [Gemmobacter sp.]MBL8562166.1 DUF533 domain-containing protein [Gemmobacter sp.]
MSLVKTLAKVAIGVAMAKGVSHLAKNGLPGSSKTTAQRSPQGQGGGFDDLVGQLGGMVGGSRGATRAGSQGGLGDLLGGMLGGGKGGAGGLGSLIEGLAGGAMGGSQPRSTRRASAPTGLEGMLGAGGIGGLLGGLLGGAGSSGGAGGMGGLGGMLDSVLQGQEPATAPSRDQELAAALMLRAMIQAVKADGEMDAAEKQKLMGALEGASEQEIAFVNAELSAESDLDRLVAQVPQGMEAQVYAVSLSAIDLDNRAEAEYLHRLAEGLGLEPAEVNGIHDQLGAQKLYG